jgi:hypothetical protein
VRIIVFAFILSVPACAARPPRVEPSGAGAKVSTGATLGWATKRLATKQPPSTLIATDATVCRVSAERFADTKPQALVLCEWQPGAP